MKTDSVYWNQIDDYLQGRLSPEEEQAMKTAIQENPALAEEVQQQEKVVVGLRQLRLDTITKQTRIWEEEIQSENKKKSFTFSPPTPARTIRFRPWLWVAAAAVVLIIFVIVLNSQSTSDDQRLALQVFSIPEVQGTRDAGDSPYRQGLTAFQNSDCATSIQQLRLVPSSDSDYPNVQFLLGLCQFRQGNYSGAQKSFEEVKEHENDIIISIGAPPNDELVSNKHINWYLALSYLANDQQKAGKKLIEEILQDTTHPYFTAAQNFE